MHALTPTTLAKVCVCVGVCVGGGGGHWGQIWAFLKDNFTYSNNLNLGQNIRKRLMYRTNKWSRWNSVHK